MYEMAQITEDLRVNCEECGIIGPNHKDEDDAWDAAATHDNNEHGCDQE